MLQYPISPYDRIQMNEIWCFFLPFIRGSGRATCFRGPHDITCLEKTCADAQKGPAAFENLFFFPLSGVNTSFGTVPVSHLVTRIAIGLSLSGGLPLIKYPMGIRKVPWFLHLQSTAVLQPGCNNTQSCATHFVKHTNTQCPSKTDYNFSKMIICISGFLVERYYDILIANIIIYNCFYWCVNVQCLSKTVCAKVYILKFYSVECYTIFNRFVQNFVLL